MADYDCGALVCFILGRDGDGAVSLAGCSVRHLGDFVFIDFGFYSDLSLQLQRAQALAFVALAVIVGIVVW